MFSRVLPGFRVHTRVHPWKGGMPPTSLVRILILILIVDLAPSRPGLLSCLPFAALLGKLTTRHAYTRENTPQIAATPASRR